MADRNRLRTGAAFGAVALAGALIGGLVTAALAGPSGTGKRAGRTTASASPSASPSPTASSASPTAAAARPKPVPPPAPPAGNWHEYYRKWASGPPARPDHFPVAVWMQDPRRERGGRDNARNYAALGVNTFVGLWDWPPDAGQLAALRAAGLTVIGGGWEGSTDSAAQARGHPLSGGTLTGYLLYDEPDLNQANGTAEGGGCIVPATVQAAAERIRAADPSRPVFVGFGKGVALYDTFGGRGPGCFQRDNGADAVEYMKACDICAVDYYAVGDPFERPRTRGLYRYGVTVDHMLRFTGGRKPVWNVIETTEFDANQTVKITPAQVRSAVWLSLVHGAAGIQYFSQRFSGPFVEDGLLADPPMAAAVRSVNAQIKALAPALNGPNEPGTTVRSSGPVRISHMTKRAGGARYVFAVGDGSARYPNGAIARGTVSVAGAGDGTVEVVGENRSVRMTGGRFTDRFDPYQAHIYKLPA